MPQEKKPPPHCAVVEAINPQDGKFWDLYVRHSKIEWTAKRGEGAAKELAYTVPWAVKHPTAIFRGVREEGERNWLCYVSTPSNAFDYRTGETKVARPGQMSAWPGEVFLAFVNDERILYTWRWEKADSSDPRLPPNYDKRFEEWVL